MAIDWNKRVQTRDGRPVRVLCQDGPGFKPVWGFINGGSNPESWRSDGAWRDLQHPLDLINVPEEMWVNMYGQRLDTMLSESFLTLLHPTQESAINDSRAEVAGRRYLGTYRLVPA